jgi:hypothetical protein
VQCRFSWHFVVFALTKHQELLSGRNTDSAQAEIQVLLYSTVQKKCRIAQAGIKWLSLKPKKYNGLYQDNT